MELAHVDFTAGLTGLPWTRSGNVIEVNTAVSFTASRYIHYGELVGATIDLGGGKLRRVVWNSEGAWTNAAAKRPTIRLDGIDGTEGATGTADVWAVDALSLRHEMTTAYSRFAIRVPSHSTVDGAYQIGQAVIGPCAFLASKYSKNRVVEYAPNFELSTGRNGTRQGTGRGVGRRRVQASWVEGVDTTSIYDASPVPNYIAIRDATTAPVASRRDSTMLEGILRRYQGGAVPMVYIPRVDEITVPTEQTQLAARERMVYGRVVSTSSRETVLGTEAKSEVVRIPSFEIEEEI